MKNFLIGVTLAFLIFFQGHESIQASSDPITFADQELSEIIINDESDATKESNQENDLQKELNMDDIFGSEQVFPFEPGFS